MLKPLFDRIVVKRLDLDLSKVGSLYIPSNAQEKPHQGRVVAVGNGKRTKDGGFNPPVLRAGDIVLFGKYSGTDVKVDGEECIIMLESDVLAVIDDETGNSPVE